MMHRHSTLLSTPQSDLETAPVHRRVWRPCPNRGHHGWTVNGRGTFLTNLEAERAALLQHVERGLRSDARIAAAWLGGSLGRGDADALSDIDLALAVVDEHCADLNTQRRAFVAQFGEPILIQEAPQNAPPGGAFVLVLYRGSVAPQEIDWFWQPSGSANIPTSARLLFDRVALPRAPAWIFPTREEVAARVSLRTTFFWAMAFIAAKKIARGQRAAAFDLMRMMDRARDAVEGLLRGAPEPAWGAIASPGASETLPPFDPAEQMAYLRDLVARMASLQPTTDGAGGLVTSEAVTVVAGFIELMNGSL